MHLAFFDLLRSIYNLKGSPHYLYTRPLCDFWIEPDAATVSVEWKIIPTDSNADSEVSLQSSQRYNEALVVSSDDSYIRPGLQIRVRS